MEASAHIRELLDAARRGEPDAIGQLFEAAREISLTTSSTRQAGEILPALTHTPEGSAIRREEAAAINALLARLPDDDRCVLELRHWHGLSFVEIAPRLGRSPDAVRKLWYRAVERL